MFLIDMYHENIFGEREVQRFPDFAGETDCQILTFVDHNWKGIYLAFLTTKGRIFIVGREDGAGAKEGNFVPFYTFR